LVFAYRTAGRFATERSGLADFCFFAAGCKKVLTDM
jgi:hypothetical protein